MKYQLSLLHTPIDPAFSADMCSPARFYCCHILWTTQDIGEFTTNANFTKACLCKKRLLERHTTFEAKGIAFDLSPSDDPAEEGNKRGGAEGLEIHEMGSEVLSQDKPH